MTCYDKCPEFTLDIDDGSGNKICKCDTTHYLYLEYEKYGNKYYRCGLESCPDVFYVNNQEEIRKNLLKSEKKCVKFCKNGGSTDNEYLWSFRNVCLKVCPVLTKPVEGVNADKDKFDEFTEVFQEKAETSGFFRAITNQNGEKKTPKSNTKKKAEASE